MGPMGCGKTTIGKLLSKKLGWPFYDGDDFHPAENKEKMRAGIPLTDEDRLPWLQRLRDEIRIWRRRDQSALLACSALKKSYRDVLGVNQADVQTIFLKGSHELLKSRIEARSHPYMAKALLQSQLEALDEPENGLIVDISPPPEEIVDNIIGSLDRHLEQNIWKPSRTSD
ncbi:MAG: gluconokinase [Desulfobacterales bacterium]|nr:gluconokinase [Desulfobacterales bacterium]